MKSPSSEVNIDRENAEPEPKSKEVKPQEPINFGPWMQVLMRTRGRRPMTHSSVGIVTKRGQDTKVPDSLPLAPMNLNSEATT